MQTVWRLSEFQSANKRVFLLTWMFQLWQGKLVRFNPLTSASSYSRCAPTTRRSSSVSFNPLTSASSYSLVPTADSCGMQFLFQSANKRVFLLTNDDAQNNQKGVSFNPLTSASSYSPIERKLAALP